MNHEILDLKVTNKYINGNDLFKDFPKFSPFINNNMTIMDIQGQAIRDYYEFNGTTRGPLVINNKYGEPEEMPVEVFFREYDDFSELDQYAISLCQGDILDVGAGAGAHSIALQHQGKQVVALDQSLLSVSIMQKMGIKHTVCKDIFNYNDQQYDTLLLLMNGIGIVGTIEAFPKALDHFKSLLKPGGQILFDSSEIDYLYDKHPKPEDRYYGELSFQYEYNGKKGEWFDWVYVDCETMASVALENGWAMQVLFEDDYGQYLAQLTLLD